MTHDELERRIEKMEMSTLKKMNYTNTYKLTDGFSEDLVKKIITKSKSQVGQRELINIIMEKYDEWKKETDPTWVIGFPGRRKIFPKYIEDMYFNIDCGEIIEEEPQMIGSWDEIPNDSNDLYLPYDVDDEQMIQDIYNQLEASIAELEAENADLKQQLEEERQKNQGIDDLPELDEVQKMTLHQKIVFFTTVTSVLLDKRYTNMRNLASFIASMCNEKPSTIAPMLSRIGQISDDNPIPSLSATLHSAAQCVSDLLLQILTDETRQDKSQIINKISENLLLNYPLPEDE